MFYITISFQLLSRVTAGSIASRDYRDSFYRRPFSFFFSSFSCFNIQMGFLSTVFCANSLVAFFRDASAWLGRRSGLWKELSIWTFLRPSFRANSPRLADNGDARLTRGCFAGKILISSQVEGGGGNANLIKNTRTEFLETGS